MNNERDQLYSHSHFVHQLKNLLKNGDRRIGRFDWSGVQLNWSGRRLQGLNYVDINFEYAILNNVNFSNATFKNCNFSNAKLRGANMVGAILENCDLTDTDFTGAILDLHLKNEIKHWLD